MVIGSSIIEYFDLLDEHLYPSMGNQHMFWAYAPTHEEPYMGSMIMAELAFKAAHKYADANPEFYDEDATIVVLPIANGIEFNIIPDDKHSMYEVYPLHKIHTENTNCWKCQHYKSWTQNGQHFEDCMDGKFPEGFTDGDDLPSKCAYYKSLEV